MHGNRSVYIEPKKLVRPTKEKIPYYYYFVLLEICDVEEKKDFY